MPSVTDRSHDRDTPVVRNLKLHFAHRSRCTVSIQRQRDGTTRRGAQFRSLEHGTRIAAGKAGAYERSNHPIAFPDGIACCHWSGRHTSLCGSPTRERPLHLGQHPDFNPAATQTDNKTILRARRRFRRTSARCRRAW
jgi:hypothetical protein